MSNSVIQEQHHPTPLPCFRSSGCGRLADCAVCGGGYTAQLGFTCSKCPGSASGIVLASFVLVVVLSAAVAVASYVISAEGAGKPRGLVERVARYVPLQSLKIVIVSWQILTQVRAVVHARTGERKL